MGDLDAFAEVTGVDLTQPLQATNDGDCADPEIP
jgi:hypothetical protein